jgi:CheY-like chemotaxis protein
MLVWVAEDDPDMRDLLVALLRRVGHRTEAFADGQALLDRLSDGAAPDALLLDHHMPVRHGLDVVAALNEEEGSVPVILITAFGDRTTHERARRLGVRRVFDKPFDLDELLRELDSILPHDEPRASHAGRAT